MNAQFHHRGRRLLVVLALLSAVAMSCGQSQDRQPSPAPRFDELLAETFSHEQVVAFIGQPFPPGASELHAAGEAALDTMVIARFDAPGQETATWLAEIGVSAPPQAGFSPFFSIDPPLSAAKDWWAPPIAGTTAGDFRGISQQVGQKHFNVVVIWSESDQVTVYLQVYNT
ncbi:MAG: hypothetical protein WA040_19470 [Anaerolineae bacterium]